MYFMEGGNINDIDYLIVYMFGYINRGIREIIKKHITNGFCLLIVRFNNPRFL